MHCSTINSFQNTEILFHSGLLRLLYIAFPPFFVEACRIFFSSGIGNFRTVLLSRLFFIHSGGFLHPFGLQFWEIGLNGLFRSVFSALSLRIIIIWMAALPHASSYFPLLPSSPIFRLFGFPDDVLDFIFLFYCIFHVFS